MRILWRTREYERTCDDCGYIWRVPKAIAHPHMQAPVGFSRNAAGVADPLAGPDPLGNVTGIEAVDEANAEQAERAAAFRRCPKCESDHYKQRSIRS